MNALVISAFKKTIRHFIRVLLKNDLLETPKFARNSYTTGSREAVILKYKIMAVGYRFGEVRV